MIYETRVTVPPNTLEVDAIEETIAIHPGIVNKLFVLWPRRTAGLGHCQIYWKAHQLWPTTPGSDFAGNGIPMEFPEELSINETPYELTVKAWNEDDTYPHTVTVQVGIIMQGQSVTELLSDLLTTGPAITVPGV
jgi:hypothetical protein